MLKLKIAGYLQAFYFVVNVSDKHKQLVILNTYTSLLKLKKEPDFGSVFVIFYIKQNFV